MGAPGFTSSPVLEDINWEKSYDFIPSHMNGHIFNEALVHFLAQNYPSIETFGLNPGMIATSGFSAAIGPSLEYILVPAVETFFQSKEHYAKNVLTPLLVSPDIKSGALFNSIGNEIVPNTWLSEDLHVRAAQLVKLNEDLLKKYNLSE